jgi:hypothetical protein
MFWTTIRQLFLTYSEQIRDSKHWWQFLAKWTLQSDTSSIPCQKMMAQLEVVEMEKSLLSVVKHVGHPHALGRIFGSSLTRGASIVLCHTSSLPGDCLLILLLVWPAWWATLPGWAGKSWTTSAGQGDQSVEI